MKTKWNCLLSSLLLGIGVLFTQTGTCTAYTLDLPEGVSLIANHLNNAGGNSIDSVLSASLAPLDDGGYTPPNTLNIFYFYPFDNNTTILGPSVYYENDFTSNVTGPASGNPSGPANGWAVDASGLVAAGALPTLNPGDGAFILLMGTAAHVTFSGTAPGGYRPLPPLNTWYLVSCMSPIPAQWQDIFGGLPVTGSSGMAFLARWNGSGFSIFKYPTGGPWIPSTPVLSVGESAFAMIDPGPQFMPIAAAAAPGCSVANTVLVTFNRELDLFTAADATHYTVTQQGGNNVAVQSAAVFGASSPHFIVPSTKLALLTLASPLITGANYTVAVNGVADLEGDITPANSTVTFLATTTPHLILAEPNPDTSSVTATFDMPMSPASAGNPANYSIVSSKGAVAAVSAATPLGPAFPPTVQGARVLLSVTGLTSNTLYTLSVSGVASACGTSVASGANASFAFAAGNPALSASLSGASLLLSWKGTNFSLLQTGSLIPPVSWQSSGAPLSTAGNNVSTHVPIGAGPMFFRLLLQ